MGNLRGVKRDFDALEARRLRAARFFQRGESQAEIARVLRVHRQTVHRWAKRVEREGRGALKKAGRAGRKPRLSAAEWRRIAKELKEHGTFASMTEGGDHGSVLVPGKPDQSVILKHVLGMKGFKRMPPEHEGESLKPAQVAVSSDSPYSLLSHQPASIP